MNSYRTRWSRPRPIARRTWSAAVMLTLCSVIAAGCSSNTTPSPGPNVPAPTHSTNSGPGGTPDALVGMWRVTDAAGEPADTVLRLSASGPLNLIVFRRCGEFTGGWAAGTSGAFVGAADGFSMACSKTVAPGDPTPGWLVNARAFRVRGNERDLISVNGTAVARLLPGGKPTLAPDLIKSLQQAPTPDPASVQQLRAVPHALPSGATPATVAILLGKWRPESLQTPVNRKAPYVEFAGNGTWTSYDGCNGGGGRWALGSGGEFVSIAGATAGVGCAAPVTDIPVSRTRRMAISGDTLTLYSTDGHLLSRLTR